MTLAWLTPDDTSGGLLCRRLVFRAELAPMVTWSLQRLGFWWSWEEHGTLSLTDTLNAVEAMMTAYYNGGDHCMIGTLCTYFTTDPPVGVLPCDGGTYDRVDYPVLYDLIDSFYVVDADQFTTPDLRGRAIIGEGSGAGLATRDLGDLGGSETVTLDITEMPSHTHQYSDAGLPDLPVVSPGELFANAFGGASNTTSAGGDQPHENMPPFAVVRFGIWAA